MILLSVLIPCTKDRLHLLNSLLQNLDNQIWKSGAKVEVLIEMDNKEKTIGHKRNVLLQKAKGRFLNFVDSDDRLPNYYLEEILKGIETNPDCCSLIGEYTCDGKGHKTFLHSIEYRGWYEEGGILYRYVNHLNCIRSSIAKKMVFPDISFSEDRSYSQQLEMSGLLKKEYKIDKVLYYYDYISNK